MSDNRTLIAKLAAMAAQTVSPREAEIAQAFLARLKPGALTRTAILDAPDRRDISKGEVAIRMPLGYWLLLAEEDVDWEIVKAHNLRVRRHR